MAANCDCIKQLNEQLAPHNVRCKTKNSMSGLRTGKPKYTGQVFLIPLEKIDTKKKEAIPVMFVLYCPICGKKYGDGKEESGA